MHKECGQYKSKSEGMESTAGASASDTDDSSACTGAGAGAEGRHGVCDGRGCQLSHLKLSTQLLAGVSSTTGAWPVATCDLTDEAKAASAYSVVYPTWADNFLECAKEASWLK